jgi:hypothetical protein
MPLEYTTISKVPFAAPDKDKFDEIASEELVKFTDFGQQLSGRVLFVRACQVKGKPAVECGLRTQTGNVKFLMNHDLQSKITGADAGRIAVIVLDGETDIGQESKMRIYRVFLSKRSETMVAIPKAQNAPAAVTGDPGITDDDIPF